MDGSEQERDEELARRLAAGDPAALAEVYDRHAAVVFALLMRIVADRPVAEELLQEAFLRAWQHADSYHPSRGRLRSWLLGIAHHLALNELRRRRRRPVAANEPRRDEVERELAGLPDPGPEPIEAAWAAVRQQELARAMARLPEPHRAVLELYAAGYTQAEIAERLGDPLGTVKTRMRRGLRRLRDELHAQGVDVD